jgi:predicted RNA binding protein with dsRBD fold (UPF0201 family)
LQILITCPVNPTEDIRKVEKALDNLIGRSESLSNVSDGEREVSLSFEHRDAMTLIRQTIHETRIIDAARKRLESNWNGTSTKIYFDKQAAFVRRTRVVDDDQELPPLGSIEVILLFESKREYEEFIDWFTPPTKDGRVIHH